MEYFSIRELVAPIIGGYWGKEISGFGNARVIRNSDVLENGMIGARVPLRTLDDDELKKATVVSGDILITMSGNVGRTAKVSLDHDAEGNPFVASNFVKILRCNQNQVIPAYLFYYLKSKSFFDFLPKYTRGVAIQNLSTKIFDQKIVPVAPLSEQKRIVTILEEIEVLKKKRAEVDEKMGAFVPALFSKLFGNQDWKSLPISDIAAVKIGPFGTQLHAKDYIEDGIPLINPTHIVEGKIKTNNHLTISISKAKTLPQYMVRTGDVVLGRRGEMGRCAVVTELEDGYMCGTGSLFLTPNTNKINPIYLQKMLSSEGTKKVLEENAKGITMKNLNITIVSKIKIPLPPLVLQNQFAEVVKEIETQEVKQKQSAENIDNVFQSLLAQVFRGTH